MFRDAHIHTFFLPVADLDASRARAGACGLGSAVLVDAVERLLLLEVGGQVHLAFVQTNTRATPRQPTRCAYVVLAIPDAAVVRSQFEVRGIAVGPLTRRGRCRAFDMNDPDGHRFEVSDLPSRRW